MALLLLTGTLLPKNIMALPAATFLNVAYGDDPRQVMDIYLPEGRSTDKTKVMFLIHGGSWSGGDKKTFTSYVDSLRSRLPDYAFVNINYRLATMSANKFPTQENDVKAALVYFVNRSAEYAVSKKVVLLGASAGAHLALLQAYKYSDPVKVLAVISFFGPVDMADLYNDPIHPQVPLLMQVFIGGTPAANPDLYQRASPIFFAGVTSCPTLIFQGGKDPLVNPKQSNMLKAKLDSLRVKNELIFYPEAGHGWQGARLSESFGRVETFLRSTLVG